MYLELFIYRPTLFLCLLIGCDCQLITKENDDDDVTLGSLRSQIRLSLSVWVNSFRRNRSVTYRSSRRYVVVIDRRDWQLRIAVVKLKSLPKVILEQGRAVSHEYVCPAALLLRGANSTPKVPLTLDRSRTAVPASSLKTSDYCRPIRCQTTFACDPPFFHNALQTKMRWFI